MREALKCEETVYHEADHFFQSLISEIRRSKKSILMHYYILDFDKIGKNVIKHLHKAVKRGVKVDLTIDGIGSSKITKKHENLIKSYGIELKIHNPLPWKSNCFINSIKNFKNINKRDHRKICIIDNEVMFIGSINLSQMHSRRFLGDQSWRDSAIRIHGKIVSETYQALTSTIQQTNCVARGSVRINNFDGMRERNLSNLIERIKRAEERIWITTPYFVPNNDILNSLNDAADRGVEVIILIPRKSDMRYFPLINSIFYRVLSSSNIKIFEYTKSILHAKVMIIDDWVLLGSSNLNSRSLFHDQELDYSPIQKESKSSILQQFHYDLYHSREVVSHDIMNRYVAYKLLSYFFKLIKNWL